MSARVSNTLGAKMGQEKTLTVDFIGCKSSGRKSAAYQYQDKENSFGEKGAKNCFE